MKKNPTKKWERHTVILLFVVLNGAISTRLWITTFQDFSYTSTSSINLILAVCKLLALFISAGILTWSFLSIIIRVFKQGQKTLTSYKKRNRKN